MTSLGLAFPPPAAPAAAAPAVQKTGYDPRTRLLIEGPIAATLIRLAAPNILVMLAQTSVGLVETYFVGKLGTDALAGVALVFPPLMLMQMMSAGAMGGGISSAIARALGAGRRADADALALHALVIGLVFGLAFTVALLASGRWLYTIMGGSGAALQAALTYSVVVFSGAVLVWLFNSLANVIRGSGNMATPARGDVHRRRRAHSTLAVSDLRPRTVAAARRRRRRRCGVDLLRRGLPRARGLSALGKKLGAAEVSRCPVSLVRCSATSCASAWWRR